MSGPIRFYRAAWSTNCERVALALARKGLAVESVWIDYDDRSAVERVSGQGLVPVLEHGGEVVADSPAIIAWLDERWPAPPLFPGSAARRAELETFVDWFNLVWKRWPNAVAARREGDPSADAALAAAAPAAMAAALDRVAALLSDGRPFLFGDAPSAADCIAYPFLKYAAHRDPADDETFHVVLDELQALAPRHAAVSAWIARMDALPRA